MLYDDFKPIVDLVLNNWTALQLAVEHGMGNPGGEKTAQLMSAYLARYCVENIVDVEDLREVIEETMDEEFETVCHDNSPREVANLLLTFLGMLKAGQHAEVQAQIAAMPKCQKWLSQPVYQSIPPQCHGNPDDDTTESSSGDEDDSPDSDSAANRLLGREPAPAPNAANGHSDQSPSNGAPSSSNPEPMEEDEPGWTTVRSRRK